MFGKHWMVWIELFMLALAVASIIIGAMAANVLAVGLSVALFSLTMMHTDRRRELAEVQKRLADAGPVPGYE